MTHSLFLAGLIAAAIMADGAWGAGIVARLPEDGVWANYELSAARTTKGEPRELGKATLRVSSVGRTVEQGEPCRWIELKRDEPGRMVIQKILVPEKHMQPGSNPVEHVIREWRKVGDQDPRPLRVEELESRLFLYLPGPLNDEKKVGTRTVDSQLGKLECDVEVGRRKARLDQRLFDGQFTSYRHDKASFGVVRWQAVLDWSGRSDRERNLDCTMTLSDQGRNARSELPNHN
jgi:hypothetical protein